MAKLNREDWHHPKNRLPLDRGAHPYKLAKRQKEPTASKGKRGYADIDQNLWEYARSNSSNAAPPSCEHWDLQLVQLGDYLNVDPEGEIHHGGDL